MTFDEDGFNRLLKSLIESYQHQVDNQVMLQLAQNEDFREFLRRYFILEIGLPQSEMVGDKMIIRDDIRLIQTHRVKWRTMRRKKEKQA